MDILENRQQWETGFGGWLAHLERTGQVDWGRYPRPRNTVGIPGQGIDLGRSRLMLISTAGGYLRDSQQPFDVDDLTGDYGIRTFPSSTPFGTLAYAHTHYDHAAVDADPQVLLPLRYLEELSTQGIVGDLAPSVVSYMGYQPDLSRVIDQTATAALRIARQEQVDAALLVPA